MAQTLKVLGQAAPSATTETDLYTVPSSTTASVSSILVCNRGGTSTTFRLSISVTGGATANKDYISYDTTIAPNSTYALTLGLTVGATDKIRCYAGNGNLSFSAYGAENS